MIGNIAIVWGDKTAPARGQGLGRCRYGLPLVSAADARMQVLPGIVVGHDLAAEGYLNATHLQYLDGLNTHVYAFRGGAGNAHKVPPFEVGKHVL